MCRLPSGGLDSSGSCPGCSSSRIVVADEAILVELIIYTRCLASGVAVPKIMAPATVFPAILLDVQHLCNTHTSHDSRTVQFPVYLLAPGVQKNPSKAGCDMGPRHLENRRILAWNAYP